jgi:site-specific DNA recombinase
VPLNCSSNCPGLAVMQCRWPLTMLQPRQLSSTAYCKGAITAETKKERYMYYRPSAHPARCVRDPKYCRKFHIREELVDEFFTEFLGKLSFDDEIMEWIVEVMRASHTEIKEENDQAILRLKREYDRLQERIYKMYLDKLDGIITPSFYENASQEWRGQQNRCSTQIEIHRNANEAFIEEGLEVLNFATNAKALFSKQAPKTKRNALKIVLSNCVWKDGELLAEYHHPFDILAQNSPEITANETGN